jgi:hypothetical protein
MAVAPDPVSVAEDAAVDTVVATLSIVGGTGTYTWLLSDGGAPSGTAFTLEDIGGNEAEIKVAVLDYEANPSVNIAGQADNGVDDAVPFALSITVTDVFEAPSVNLPPHLLILGMM